MKNVLKLATIAAIALFASNSFAGPYKEITTDELVKMKAENKDLVVIDSRGGDWFDGTLIEGAVQLATSDTNAESLAKIAPDKAKPIVFYCTNEQCPASAKAAHKAAEIGYTNILKYPAGIEGWKKAGLATVTTKPAEKI
jgi:thiosulfate/3-mercaptopyruvate sulfurtransferase